VAFPENLIPAFAQRRHDLVCAPVEIRKAPFLIKNHKPIGETVKDPRYPLMGMLQFLLRLPKFLLGALSGEKNALDVPKGRLS
jgi:hypothetical protein